MTLPVSVAPLMLEDLRRAAMYLEELGESERGGREAVEARHHALRLWNASQAMERIVMAIESLMVQERSRQAYEADS